MSEETLKSILNGYSYELETAIDSLAGLNKIDYTRVSLSAKMRMNEKIQRIREELNKLAININN